MFKSFKLFVGQTIAKDDILKNLEAFRYQHTQRAIQEGEYAQRGEIIDIFPANFDSPVRIDLDDDPYHRSRHARQAHGFQF